MQELAQPVHRLERSIQASLELGLTGLGLDRIAAELDEHAQALQRVPELMDDEGLEGPVELELGAQLLDGSLGVGGHGAGLA